MNILHLSETPLSGAPYRLMQVQRNGGIDARLISHRNSYDGRNIVTFPFDVLLQSGRSNREKWDTPDFCTAEIHQLFSGADILHFHNAIDEQYIFRLFPDLKKYLSKKLVVVQFHSPRLSLKNVEKTLKHKDVDRRFVVAQYQVRQFPQAIPVPNAIPIYDDLHSPIHRNNSPPIITYSPSNTHLRDWNNKGFAETINAIKRTKENCTSLIITSKPLVECLKAKQQADIAIDEVVTGSYHLNTLEALSQGQVAICGLDAKCEQVLLDYIQDDHHPIVISNPKGLTSVLDSLLKDYDFIQYLQRKSRTFMEKYWSTEYINNHFKKAYNV